MKLRFFAPLSAALALQLTACAPAMKSYADPAFRKVSAQQIVGFEQRVPVRVEVQFMQQGKPKPDSDLRLRTLVEGALAKSKVFTVQQQSASVFRVVVDNVGDLSEGRIAGFKTGASLGLSGAVVTDQYQFNITYSGADKAQQATFFKHEMHTAVGGVDLPEGVVPENPGTAFQQIVEDALMAKVQQLQDEQIVVDPAVARRLEAAAAARRAAEAEELKTAELRRATELRAAELRAAELKAAAARVAAQKAAAKKPAAKPKPKVAAKPKPKPAAAAPKKAPAAAKPTAAKPAKS